MPELGRFIEQGNIGGERFSTALHEETIIGRRRFKAGMPRFQLQGLVRARQAKRHRDLTAATQRRQQGRTVAWPQQHRDFAGRRQLPHPTPHGMRNGRAAAGIGRCHQNGDTALHQRDFGRRQQANLSWQGRISHGQGSRQE